MGKTKTVKKTIREFNSIFNLIYKKVDLTKNDKLTYAVKKLEQRFSTEAKPHQDAINRKIDEYKVKHASEDVDGNLVMLGDIPNQTYAFSKANKLLVDHYLITCNNELLAKDVEIEPYFIDGIQSAVERALKTLGEFECEDLIGVLFEIMPSSFTEEPAKES